MKFEAKVIEDSISLSGARLTTLQLCYPRFVHSEFMTHRVFSRNASSSRAIPVEKMISQVRNSPAMPVHWGANQKGMQARQEVADIEGAKSLWIQAAEHAAWIAGQMALMSVHKQVANRILEPFQWIHVIVTATEWNNFFELRNHVDADPNIQLLTQLMYQAMQDSKPVKTLRMNGFSAGWHLPYVNTEERKTYLNDPKLLAKISAARCARVSYLTHDGQTPSIEKDIGLFNQLVGSKPLHASPVEHQATPCYLKTTWSGNFQGWDQWRKTIEKDIKLS